MDLEVRAVGADSFNSIMVIQCLRCFSGRVPCWTDWLQSLKQFFINVSYHVLVANLIL